MGTTFVTANTHEKKSFEAGKEVGERALEKMKGQKPHFALLFASAQYDYSQVIEGVQSVVGSVPLIGCSSSGEFTEEGVFRKSVVLALVHSDTHRFMTGSSDRLRESEFQTIEMASEKFPRFVEGFPHNSVLFLMDGLASKGEEAVSAACALLGPTVKFAGACAGDDMEFEKTEVFCNGSSFTNGVSLGMISSKEPVSIGVKHGHTPLSKVLKVTKAEKNVLYEINERPALSVWKEVILENKLAKEADFSTPDALRRILLRYVGGVLVGNEYKVRYPVSANPDGSMNFLCTIPEGSQLKIMRTSEKEEIESAKLAVQAALKKSNGRQIAGAIVFDCVCRGALLEAQYPKAIQTIKSELGNVPFIGIETYGEIAMELGQPSGFHNTTTVILLIPN